jgi:hypothetical protein
MTETIVPHPPLPRADLISLSEKDIEEIATFIAAQSGRTKESVKAHLQWFLLENPALRTGDPLGFALRSADQLVGCILCSPQTFCFGKQTIRLMGSSSFYVDEAHRGHGGRLFLQYSRLARQQPLFGNSANAEAAALWKAVGAIPVQYSEAELFGVLHWPPVLEEFVHRRYSNRLFDRLAGSPVAHLAGQLLPLKLDDVASDALKPLTSAAEVIGLRLQPSTAKLTALRDLPYIRWRYFSGRDATAAAFAFHSRQLDQEVLVTVNQRTRGYRDQINALNLLDVYPEVPAAEWLRIVGALIARYRKVVDAVVLRSLQPDLQELFCARGFRRRTFEAPLGWYLDKAKLLPTVDWYPVAADGDALI